MIERMDAALIEWLQDGPQSGPPEPLARALALARATPQRPGWRIRDHWIDRGAVPATKLALAVTLFLAVLLAVALAIGTPRTLPEPFDNAPIPMQPALEAELIGHVNGWGYRISTVPDDAPSPRVSAVQATQVAGQDLLESLRSNAMPPQDVSLPDGLIRRQLFDPNDRELHVVWVVTYRWKVGFDCTTEDGGPGTCPVWEAFMIDDQTGVLVTSFSATNSQA